MGFAFLLALALGIAEASVQDIDRNIKEIALFKNLSIQEYTVLTEDGYLLGLFRIPGKLEEQEVKPGPPVLLMHGIFDSADSWILNDERSPAVILSKAGYDVWLGNSRGNKYSRSHIALNPESEEFWNFSWEEAGKHDLPALTDFILSRSEHNKLAFIGHSIGATQAFYAITTNNDYYRNKWGLFVALSPPLSMKG